MRKLFGTDGIRGVANSELTPELAFKMGRIVASLLGSGDSTPHPFFLLGRDTRLSGTMLEGALAAGITSAGLDVRLLGIVSTPAVAFLTVQLKAAGGVMISASHNPVPDNGIKFFNGQGFKLPSDLEAEAERLYFTGDDQLPRPTGRDVGCSFRAEKALQHYLSFLKRQAPELKGLKIALDCAHGSLCRIAPRLYRELGAEVIPLSSTPHGGKINVNCGSTNPASLQRAVKEKGAHLGLAFDGDGDRLIAVDEGGQVVDGDTIMAVCAAYLKEKNKLRGGRIVATVMSNGGLDLAGEEHGFTVLRTEVGDRYVLEEMLRGHYVLGGEQSGHIIFSDIMAAGDGLLTSLQLLKVMVGKGEPLSSLAAIMRRLPQLLVNCRVKNKEGWEKNRHIAEAVKAAQEKIGRGRVFIRASGTEPLIRIMLEGEDSALLEGLSRELAATVEQEMGV
ncbi:MAG: phosphoglucosamine mutase [Dethiobacter sp.]|jgi:phosphoglucosamine mutase|nr:MAG: phosphoglucosamine mutase [Dethiobacter sp.]